MCEQAILLPSSRATLVVDRRRALPAIGVVIGSVIVLGFVVADAARLPQSYGGGPCTYSLMRLPRRKPARQSASRTRGALLLLWVHRRVLVHDMHRASWQRWSLTAASSWRGHSGRRRWVEEAEEGEEE